MNRARSGRAGEERAASFLERKGIRIIERNVRCPRGEIDLVALDEGETIVFIEVKNWSVYGMENLQYSIDMGKQRRIIETAKFFLASHREYNNKIIRFDVIFVSPVDIVHLESAFMERV